MPRSLLSLSSIPILLLCACSSETERTVEAEVEPAAPRYAPGPVITLSGRAMTVNGQEQVPLGLFGVHAVGVNQSVIDDLGVTTFRQINFVPSGGSKFQDRKTGTLKEEYRNLDVMIDCQGDRFREPVQLHDPKGYREACANMGKSYGERWLKMTAESGKRGIVQWWNEAYLNWAERSAGGHGSTIRQHWYKMDDAVDGGPVTLKGQTKPLRHFRWRSLWPTRYHEGVDKKGKAFKRRIIGWSVKIPPGLKEGDSFHAAETRYWRSPGTKHEWTLERHWFPEDRTRVSYWSGRQNRDFYMESFEPWARALRAANPDVTILAGWDFNYSAGGWATWVELYRPLLQEFPELVDGVTEHHYGLNPSRIQSWYEVGTGEAMALTGRWLKNWNTETQGRLDPAVYGASGNAVGNKGTAVERAVWEANYNLADMIGLAARMPAKVGSRTIHNFAGRGFMDCGGAWALRLLKPLRGRLQEVKLSGQECWAVACRREDGSVVLAIYNDAAEDLRVHVQAIGGRAPMLRRVEATETGLQIAEQRLVPGSHPGYWPVELASRHAVLVVFEQDSQEGVAVRKQYFSTAGALQRYYGRGVMPKPKAATGNKKKKKKKTRPSPGLKTKIILPEGALADVQAAQLRLVIDEYRGPVELLINGKPWTVQAGKDVCDWVIPLELLQEGENTIAWLGKKPFLLVSCSLLLDS